MYKYSKIIILLVVFLNLLSACAVCYGAPDHPVTQSLNKAIMSLLLTVVFVLSCIVYGIVSMYRRTKTINMKESE